MAIPLEGEGYSKCIMYDTNYTEILSNGIKISDPTWSTKKCQHGWEFNYTDIPYSTIATEVRYFKDINWKIDVDQRKQYFSVFFCPSAYVEHLESYHDHPWNVINIIKGVFDIMNITMTM